MIPPWLGILSLACNFFRMYGRFVKSCGVLAFRLISIIVGRPAESTGAMRLVAAVVMTRDCTGLLGY